MKSIRVMVTGVGGGGVGEQILKALRKSQNNYYIIGGDMNYNSKGFSMVDKAYILPSAKADNYIDVTLRICKQNKVDVLFYGSEPELKVLSEHREIFKNNQIFLPLNPKEVIDICMDKNKTMDWLNTHNFDIPNYRVIRKLEDINTIDFVPAVLKPSVGGGGSNNTFIARNIEEMKNYSKYLLGMYEEFIIQEYVGTPNSEYTVGVLHDMEGQYINSIAVKKNILTGLSNKMKVPNTTGIDKYGDMLVISNGISQGEIGRFPEVTEVCKRIAAELKCKGSINIQCRMQDQKVYIFEINPRISGTTSLRALVGYNEPDILIKKQILNENIETDFPYQSGYIARGLEETLLDEKVLKVIQ